MNAHWVLGQGGIGELLGISMADTRLLQLSNYLIQGASDTRCQWKKWGLWKLLVCGITWIPCLPNKKGIGLVWCQENFYHFELLLLLVAFVWRSLAVISYPFLVKFIWILIHFEFNYLIVSEKNCSNKERKKEISVLTMNICIIIIKCALS